MIVEYVTFRVALIRTKAGDNEVAHVMEDSLYKDVLGAISEGATNPASLAAAALKAEDIDFSRWYA